MMRTLPTPSPGASCPQCAGLRMYALTYNHTATCTLRARTDSRGAADHAMFGSFAGTRTRDTTTTERALLIAAGIPEQAIPDQVDLDRVTTSVLVPRWDGIDLGGIP